MSKQNLTEKEQTALFRGAGSSVMPKTMYCVLAYPNKNKNCIR